MTEDDYPGTPNNDPNLPPVDTAETVQPEASSREELEDIGGGVLEAASTDSGNVNPATANLDPDTAKHYDQERAKYEEKWAHDAALENELRPLHQKILRSHKHTSDQFREAEARHINAEIDAAKRQNETDSTLYGKSDLPPDATNTQVLDQLKADPAAYAAVPNYFKVEERPDPNPDSSRNIMMPYIGPLTANHLGTMGVQERAQEYSGAIRKALEKGDLSKAGEAYLDAVRGDTLGRDVALQQALAQALRPQLLELTNTIFRDKDTAKLRQLIETPLGDFVSDNKFIEAPAEQRKTREMQIVVEYAAAWLVHEVTPNLRTDRSNNSLGARPMLARRLQVLAGLGVMDKEEIVSSLAVKAVAASDLAQIMIGEINFGSPPSFPIEGDVLEKFGIITEAEFMADRVVMETAAKVAELYEELSRHNDAGYTEAIRGADLEEINRAQHGTDGHS